MLSESASPRPRGPSRAPIPREIIAEYSRARSLFTLRGFTAAFILRSVERARARARGFTARVVEVLPIRFAFDRRTFHLQQRYYLSRVSRFSYPLLLLLLLLFLLPLAGHIPVSHSHYVPPPPPRADVRSCRWNAMQRKRMAHGGQKSRIAVFHLAAALFRRSVSPRDLARGYRYVCAHLPIHLSRLSVQYTPPVVHARSS